MAAVCATAENTPDAAPPPDPFTARIFTYLRPLDVNVNDVVLAPELAIATQDVDADTVSGAAPATYSYLVIDESPGSSQNNPTPPATPKITKPFGAAGADD
ncbi:hypothetical protein [Candidatus Poriferisodalis sp.]|uniref:hypothetical protein n=1 Tax=Candidatus Poriferisodalis sp. TaxID=3101277 RepID=UPI003B020B84